MTTQPYQTCIDACLECATECNQCAVACLEEKEVQNLTQCIRLNLECAVVCRATAELLTAGSAYASQLCELCADICNACAEKCEQHANMGMEHCRECAEACRTCARETMEIAKEASNKSQGAYQDECAILSRATAELLSLGSEWAKKISGLNATVCSAAAEMLDKEQNVEMEHCSKCAAVAKEAHHYLEMQEDESKVDKAEESGDKENADQKKEVIKKHNKHSSALLTASMGRSAVDSVRAHSSRTIRGGRSEIANTGTIINYGANE